MALRLKLTAIDPSKAAGGLSMTVLCHTGHMQPADAFAGGFVMTLSQHGSSVHIIAHSIVPNREEKWPSG